MIETFGAIIAPMGVNTPPELMLLTTIILAALTVGAICIVLKIIGEAIDNFYK